MTPPVEGERARADRDVSASEVAAYAYCAKAWHLERVLGERASDAAGRNRAAGVGRHDAHGSRVVLLGATGPALAGAAAVLLALGVLLAFAALVLGH